MNKIMFLVIFVVGVIFALLVESIIVLFKNNKEQKALVTDVIVPKKEKEVVTINTPYVIMTHVDEDGAGPAIMARYYFGDENVTVFSNPNGVMNANIREIMNWKIALDKVSIFITDISCSPQVAKELSVWMESHPNITIRLFDHHKTALALNDFDFCKVQVEKNENSLQILDEVKDGDYGLSCGTSLFYEFLTNEMGFEKNLLIEEYVNLITAFDTWMWKTHLGGKEIYKTWDEYFELLGFNTYIEEVLSKLRNNTLEFTDIDHAIFMVYRNKCEKYVERALKRCSFRKWFGYNCCFVQIDEYLSDVCETVFDTFENVDVLVMVLPNSLSFRTRKDGVDVSAIAKTFGGGGHAGAAGCQLPKDLTSKYYSMICNMK